ncbi:MAG: hypothetical protein JWP40_973 [Blastococcus sp.]|nr:hypothetical protein [Blastococcus sp.]
MVLVFCDRCGELVSATFVDRAEVLGLAGAGGDCWLGATSAARVAVDLVAAVIAQDDTERRRWRREAVARPGDSIDALAQLAAVLSRMGTPGQPCAALHAVADRVERSVVERELLDVCRAGDES